MRRSRVRSPSAPPIPLPPTAPPTRAFWCGMTGQDKGGHTPDGAGMETDIWSSYWRGPRLVCSLAGTGIGYPEALVEVWQRFFAQFPEGTRLLDIATGNGAVAIIASDTARSLGRHFEV